MLFNVGDYVGRFVAEKLQWPKPGKIGTRWGFSSATILCFSIARFVFIPLFLYGNELNSDTAYIIIMTLFSASNGYLCSICMMSAPQICHSQDQSTASSLMVAALGIGLCTGATLSSALTKLYLMMT